jgi:CDP-diacylglycerol--serine O-phosphatidyltransferase
MFGPKGERRKALSFNRMIPNMLTMLAVCAGLTALRFGLEGRWEPAVWSLVIAAILDALDGRIARLLKSTSKLLLYLWTMKSAGPIGWVLVLLFSVCCALRLARFNTDLEKPDQPPWTKNFFTGVPAPAGAGLVLLPLIMSFHLDWPILRHPLVVGPVIVAVAFLLVSRIPTYSFKNVRIPRNYALFLLLTVALLAALIVSAPWLTLTLILFLYLISIAFSPASYKKLERQAAENPDATLDFDDDDDEDDEPEAPKPGG